MMWCGAQTMPSPALQTTCIMFQSHILLEMEGLFCPRVAHSLSFKAPTAWAHEDRQLSLQAYLTAETLKTQAEWIQLPHWPFKGHPWHQSSPKPITSHWAKLWFLLMCMAGGVWACDHLRPNPTNYCEEYQEPTPMISAKTLPTQYWCHIIKTFSPQRVSRPLPWQWPSYMYIVIWNSQLSWWDHQPLAQDPTSSTKGHDYLPQQSGTSGPRE